MGLIGKIALIGIVSVAVLIAVIWDWQNENRRENGRTTNARQIEDNLPENITTEETLNPETPQDQTPPVTGRPQEPEQQAREAGPDTPAPPEDQTGPPEQEPEPGPPQPAAAGEKYVIQKNDTLSRIARKFYGDSKLWPSIHAANIDAIPDPEVLKVGTEIVIPPKEEVLREGPRPTLPAVETYIVQKSDTLSSISRMHYGSSAYTELIYQANTDRIKNKNVLKPDTVLVIPALSKKPR